MGCKFEEDGVEDRIKKARKGAYHNEHFKGDDKVEDECAPEERFPRIHVASSMMKDGCGAKDVRSIDT